MLGIFLQLNKFNQEVNVSPPPKRQMLGYLSNPIFQSIHLSQPNIVLSYPS